MIERKKDGKMMTRMLAKQRGHRGLGFPKLGAGKEARGGETLGRWVEGSVDWGFPTTANSARPGGVPKPDQRSQHRESKVFGHHCHPRSGRARGEGGKKTSFTSERGCPEAAFVLIGEICFVCFPAKHFHACGHGCRAWAAVLQAITYKNYPCSKA